MGQQFRGEEAMLAGLRNLNLKDPELTQHISPQNLNKFRTLAAQLTVSPSIIVREYLPNDKKITW